MVSRFGGRFDGAFQPQNTSALAAPFRRSVLFIPCLSFAYRLLLRIAIASCRSGL
jgi:hypothetical protein